MENEKEKNEKQESLFDLGDEIKKDKDLKPKRRAEIEALEKKQLEKKDVALAQQILENRIQLFKNVRMAAIKMTLSEDWVIYVEKDTEGNDREYGYCQDVGCYRANKILGINVENVRGPFREDFLKTDDQDASFSYSYIGDGFCAFTGEELKDIEGSRWSGSRFFKRQKTPDPSNVKKSARANCDGRIIRPLAQLSRMPIQTLIEAGLDPKKMSRVEFKTGEAVKASDAQYKMIHELASQKVIDFSEEIAKDATPTDLTKPQASELISKLMKLKSQEKDAEAYLQTINNIKDKVKGWDDVTEKPKDKKGDKK